MTQRLRYTADFDLPDDAEKDDIKEQMDSIVLSIVRQKNGTITVSPTNGALTTRTA